MKRTPLYDLHQACRARFIAFSGWEMPLSFSGMIEEHHAVRNNVGLFDISHMGRFELSGSHVKTALAHLVPTAIHKLKAGEAHYAMFLNEAGGILDDIYIYKKGSDRFLLIVNAANREKDYAWLHRHLPPSASLKDLTDETALLALQGPNAWEVLVRTIPFGKEEIALRAFIETELIGMRGVPVLIARTGYTGERGYEIVIPSHGVLRGWEILMEAGRALGIQPIGLGARDTLRLEMGYPLYGHDMDETTTPLEAGLASFLHFGKEFMGKGVLVSQRDKGLLRKQICFELTGAGVPREGCPISSGSKEIGKVTSGNFSPTLRRGIGIGYVEARYAEERGEIFINIRGKGAHARIVKKPFYKKRR